MANVVTKASERHSFLYGYCWEFLTFEWDTRETTEGVRQAFHTAGPGSNLWHRNRFPQVPPGVTPEPRAKNSPWAPQGMTQCPSPLHCPQMSKLKFSFVYSCFFLLWLGQQCKRHERSRVQKVLNIRVLCEMWKHAPAPRAPRICASREESLQPALLLFREEQRGLSKVREGNGHVAASLRCQAVAVSFDQTWHFFGNIWPRKHIIITCSSESHEQRTLKIWLGAYPHPPGNDI